MPLKRIVQVSVSTSQPGSVYVTSSQGEGSSGPKKFGGLTGIVTTQVFVPIVIVNVATPDASGVPVTV